MQSEVRYDMQSSRVQDLSPSMTFMAVSSSCNRVGAIRASEDDKMLNRVPKRQLERLSIHSSRDGSLRAKLMEEKGGTSEQDRALLSPCLTVLSEILRTLKVGLTRNTLFGDQMGIKRGRHRARDQTV